MAHSSVDISRQPKNQPNQLEFKSSSDGLLEYAISKEFSVERGEGVGLISFLTSLFFLSMMINLKYL